MKTETEFKFKFVVFDLKTLKERGLLNAFRKANQKFLFASDLTNSYNISEVLK